MSRPDIPEPTKRAVRKRCGFCCVICGCPVYDYDHIEEYSIVKKHEEDNLVLLCPTCHRKKGKGLISREAIIKSRDLATSRVATETDSFEAIPYRLDIGGNIVSAFPGGLGFRIDGFGFLEFKMGRVPKINAEILKPDGSPAIKITEGEYKLYSDTWDIEYAGNTLTFRNAPREIFASITIDTNTQELKIRGVVGLTDGIDLRITDDGIFVKDIIVARSNIVEATECALLITKDLPNTGAMLLYSHMDSSIVHGIDGVSCFNCVVNRNVMHACTYAFVWTPDYLIAIANKNT